MASNVYYNEDHTLYIFKGFLSFHPDEGVKFSVREPNASAGSRIMQVEYVLPVALFKAPQLKARITVDANGAAHHTIDAKAAQEALQAVIGARVQVIVEHPEPAQ